MRPDLDLYNKAATGDMDSILQIVKQLSDDFYNHIHDGNTSQLLQRLRVGSLTAQTSVIASESLAVVKSSYADTTAGIWAGLSGGVAKINIGNATYYVKWDGTNIEVKGNISGSTITGSTLSTGTSGNNVDITTGRISQRSGTTEVVYSDVGTNGGAWGFKDINGNVVFTIAVEGTGTAHDVAFRGAATNSGAWIFDCKDGINLASGMTYIDPLSNNTVRLGTSSYKFADVRSTLINGADYCFENDWCLTEHYNVGLKEKGIAVLNEKNDLMLFIGEKGIYVKDGKIKNLNSLKWKKTTQKQRVQNSVRLTEIKNKKHKQSTSHKSKKVI